MNLDVYPRTYNRQNMKRSIDVLSELLSSPTEQEFIDKFDSEYNVLEGFKFIDDLADAIYTSTLDTLYRICSASLEAVTEMLGEYDFKMGETSEYALKYINAHKDTLQNYSEEYLAVLILNNNLI